MERKEKLSPLQYEVTQLCGTEPPFNNTYWNNKEEGIYVDIVSGEALFSSNDKFDSGTGWPSFTKPIEKGVTAYKEDTSHGLKRVEVRSKGAASHLGHVFDDGPGPEGKRYCINSASLNFIPVNMLAEKGYGEYIYLFYGKNLEKATFGAGCFWGVEHILQDIPGVVQAAAGYSGGKTKDPTYNDISTGLTGHAEVVHLYFDPEKVSFETLLDYFFRLHDPTTENRQGVDVGSQYRSVIFYHNEKQKNSAIKVKNNFDAQNSIGEKSVTEITKYSQFYPAEEYHQDYYFKTGGRICHTLRDEM